MSYSLSLFVQSLHYLRKLNLLTPHLLATQVP